MVKKQSSIRLRSRRSIGTSMRRKAGDDWTSALFVERPELFAPFLVAGKPKGNREAVALAKLYGRHGLRRGSRILDVCCGIGRIAVPLASLGYRVLGIDLSPRLVASARRYARARRVASRVKFVVGDYRDLSSLAGEAPFDGVLNTFTSMGHYGKEADRKAFGELAKLTAPGGVFVLKTINRDWILRHFERRGWER